MSGSIDYYKVLGVGRKASEQEVKQAYRRLARRFHPDLNPGDKTAEAKFKEINEAHGVLSDPQKRKKYDQYGELWEHAEQFADAGRGRASRREDRGGPSQDSSQVYEWGDLGRSGGGVDLGDIFDTFFQGSRGRRRPRRGRDREQPVEVTLEEAYSGTERVLRMPSVQSCSYCSGSGIAGQRPCSTCGGSGQVARERRLEVKVPPGVANGSRIRIAGEGEPGQLGGRGGDLYLVVKMRPHPLFEREGDNLKVEVAVPLRTAILGGEVEVPTPKGKVALKMPPETQNGKVFRLAGKGMPHLGKSARGDLFARMKVVLPTGLSPEQRGLFEKLPLS